MKSASAPTKFVAGSGWRCRAGLALADLLARGGHHPVDEVEIERF